MTWKTQRHNEIMYGDNFYISYNPNTGNTDPAMLMLTKLGNEMLEAIGEKGKLRNGQPETALYADGIWYILDGDFREEYLAAMPRLENILAVYKKHALECRSAWSTDEDLPIEE